MKITPKMDVLGLVAQTAQAQKNLVFSVAQGINATALQIQEAEKAELRARFQLRVGGQKLDYLNKQVAIIKPFANANKGQLYADVALGGKKKGILLGGYETGEERLPFKGKMVAQPVVGGPARPNFANPVAQQFTFQGMKLKATKARGKNAKPGDDLKGKNHTFTIPGLGVFTRVGLGRRDLKMVYHFAKHQKLPAKLGWMKTAQDVAAKFLDENIRIAFTSKKPRKP